LTVARAVASITSRTWPRITGTDTIVRTTGRYVLAHPFEHGHFEHFGPSYRYHVERFDRDPHRFWFPGGFSFEIAAWDWPVAAEWCWDCDGDSFVVYDDADHPGWYLLYNAHTGEYVHVNYLGS